MTAENKWVCDEMYCTNKWVCDEMYCTNKWDTFKCIVSGLIELYKLRDITELQNKACLIDKIICYWKDYYDFHPLFNQDVEFTYACVEFEYKLECLRSFMDKIRGQQITVMEIVQFGSHESEIFRAVSRIPSLVYHIENNIDQNLKEKFITRMHEYAYQNHQTNAHKINVAELIRNNFH